MQQEQESEKSSASPETVPTEVSYSAMLHFGALVRILGMVVLVMEATCLHSLHCDGPPSVNSDWLMSQAGEHLSLSQLLWMRQDLHFQLGKKWCIERKDPGLLLSSLSLDVLCRHGEYYLLLLATVRGISFLVSYKHLRICAGIAVKIFDWSVTTGKQTAVFNSVKLQVR